MKFKKGLKEVKELLSPHHHHHHHQHHPDGLGEQRSISGDENPGRPSRRGEGRLRRCWTTLKSTTRFPSTSTSPAKAPSPSPARAPPLHTPAQISPPTNRRPWPTSINTSNNNNNKRQKYKHKNRTRNKNRRANQKNFCSQSPSRRWRRKCQSLTFPRRALSDPTTRKRLPILSSSTIQRTRSPTQVLRSLRQCRLWSQDPCCQKPLLQSRSRSLQPHLSFLCRQNRRLLPSTSPFLHCPSSRNPSRNKKRPRFMFPSS